MRRAGLEALLLLHDGMKAACDAGTLAENVRPYITLFKTALRQCMGDSTADAADWCASWRRLVRSAEERGMRPNSQMMAWLAANEAHIDQMLAGLADERDENDDG